MTRDATDARLNCTQCDFKRHGHRPSVHVSALDHARQTGHSVTVDGLLTWAHLKRSTIGEPTPKQETQG